MRNLITCLLLIFFAVPAWAQAPVGDYTELEDSRPRDTAAKWDAQKAPVQLQWGSTDVRYAKWNVPAAVSAVKWTTRAWRGERVNAQAVLWTARELGDLAVSVSDLRSGREVIPASAAEPHFVR